jgi:hypothetical protein
MLFSKLLVDVVVGLFAGENRYRQRKYAAKSACTASLRPLAITSGPGRHLRAFSSKKRGQLALWAG